MAKAVLEAEVKGVGKILRVDASFDEALKSLKSEGVRYLISIRNLAYSRIQTGKRNSLSQNGSYTREGFLYAPNNPVLVALTSPLLSKELAKQATEVNSGRNCFSTQDTQIYDRFMAQAEKDKDEEPKKRKVLILPYRENFKISGTQNFKILQGLLKDQAEKYLEFNGQNIPVYLVNKDIVDKQDGTLLTQLWFRSLHGKSGLRGDGRGLYYYGGVRGVLPITGEASSQKIRQVTPQEVETYTPKQISAVLKRLKLSGLEDTIIQGLKQ